MKNEGKNNGRGEGGQGAPMTDTLVLGHYEAKLNDVA